MVSDGGALPNPSYVVRFVGVNKMFKDENDKVLGPSAAAFEMKPTEDHLSVTWCEFFVGSHEEQLRCAIEALRNSLSVGPKACFCIVNTEDLRAAAAEFGATTCEVFLPVEKNPAHAGVYGISPDNKQLLEKLAGETWAEFVTRETTDALPLTGCAKSQIVT